MVFIHIGSPPLQVLMKLKLILKIYKVDLGMYPLLKLYLSKLTSSIIPPSRKVFNIFIISKLGSKSPLQDPILPTTIIYRK